MSRFLFAPVAATGHVNPGLPIAAELVRRGHEVRWYTTSKFEQKVRSVGAQFVPYARAYALEEGRINEQFPERVKLKGIAQFKYDMKHVFIDQMPGLFEDLSEELQWQPADVLVGDTATSVCALIARKYSLAWATYGISVLLQSSRDTAPFGLGLFPNATSLGRLRNAGLYWLVNNVIFKDPFDYYDAMVERLIKTRPQFPMLDFANGSHLFLQGCSPSFEYPRSDMPKNVRFIGAFVPAADPDWTPPDWWERLDSGRPVIIVTQGTIATEYEELILPAIRALANAEWQVVVTTGSRPPSALGLDSLPDNVIVEQFVPYAHLMPRASLLLTNGGYGSVQMALAHGTPIVVFGGSEEKPEVARRVSWSGVGLGFKSKRPSEAQIRTAVRKVLSTPSYRSRAQQLREELLQFDDAKLCGDLLESLIGATAHTSDQSNHGVARA
jgi:MGT family glycosyltransferase